MAIFSLKDIRLSGVAAAVPKQEVSNWDYELLTESERRLLVKTTGVEKRRTAPEGMATSDLCFAAAESLLDRLAWDREEVGALVFLSQSRDYYLPATGIILQDRLGLSKQCLAFDVGLGCSGYVYGLSIIGGLMRSAGIKKGLLMMGDISSATCNYEDKSTYPLFGDAGTVSAIEWDEEAPAMHFNLKSDGKGYQSIMIPDGGIRNRVSPDSFTEKEIDKGIKRSDLHLALNGLDVFNFSITQVHPTIKELYEFLGTDSETYAHFVMHQANKLMNETIRKKLKFPPEKVPYSIDRFGNTSSASIPLTMVTELAETLSAGSHRLLLSGFGVGLSWGVVDVQTENLVLAPLIEL